MAKVYLAQHLSPQQNIDAMLTHGMFVTKEYNKLIKAKAQKPIDFKKYVKFGTFVGGVLTLANLVSPYSRIASFALSLIGGAAGTLLLQKQKSQKETDQIAIISGIYHTMSQHFLAERTKKRDRLCETITNKCHVNKSLACKEVEDADQKDADPLKDQAKKILTLVNPMNRLMPNLFGRTGWDELVRECRRYIKPLKDEIVCEIGREGKIVARRDWSDSLYW